MDELTSVFKILSDKNRLRIISLLSHGKMCVCVLAYVLDVTQPSISRHLKRMKQAGLIRDEQAGLWTNYYLNSGNERAKIILDHLKNWFEKDKTAAADLNKLKKADRAKICKIIN